MNTEPVRETWFGWSTALLGFCELADELGCEASAILDQFGFEPAALLPPGRPASTLSLFGAMALLADRSNRPDVALRLLRYQPFEVLGSLGDAVRRQGNLGDALEQLNSVIHTRGTGYVPSLERAGDTAIIRFKSLLPAGKLQDLQLDYNIGSAVLTVRGLIGDDWAPDAVELTRLKPSTTGTWSSFFGCPVRFGAEANLIVFDSTDLQRSLSAKSESAAPRLPSEGSVPIDFTQLVDREIIRNLGRGTAGLPAVAAALGVNTRTIQRRLERAGTSYQARLDDIRKAWAAYHIDSDHMSLTELSQLLGFGDLATFSRTFKRWHGLPPRTWRKVKSSRLSQ